MSNVSLSSSLSLIVPPTAETGRISYSLWLTVQSPTARSMSPFSETRRYCLVLGDTMQSQFTIQRHRILPLSALDGRDVRALVHDLGERICLKNLFVHGAFDFLAIFVADVVDHGERRRIDHRTQGTLVNFVGIQDHL